jgi:hypothetical protein
MTTPTTHTTTTTNPPTTNPPTGTTPPDGGASAGDTAPAAAAAKPNKKKSSPKKPEIALVAIVKNPTELTPAIIADVIKAGRRIFVELPAPKGFDKSSKNARVKAAYKPAVRASLEKGEGASDYNHKDLGVIAIHERFKFGAKIEAVEVKKVTITEG